MTCGPNSISKCSWHCRRGNAAVGDINSAVVGIWVLGVQAGVCIAKSSTTHLSSMHPQFLQLQPWHGRKLKAGWRRSTQIFQALTMKLISSMRCRWPGSPAARTPSDVGTSSLLSLAST